MMDILARRLGMDPVEVRRVNFISREEFPYQTPVVAMYDSGDYLTAFNKALEKVGYSEFRKQQEEARKKGRLLGIGISSYVEICGLGPSRAVRSTGFGLGLWRVLP
jgi:carbon-monoxide dehydrogenase large subunit